MNKHTLPRYLISELSVQELAQGSEDFVTVTPNPGHTAFCESLMAPSYDCCFKFHPNKKQVFNSKGDARLYPKEEGKPQQWAPS